MVRDRWPVPLDVVALRRQIATDAVGDLAPWSVGKQAIHAGERPVRLARVVLRVATLDRGSRRDVVARSNGAGRLDLADQERASLVISPSALLSPVASRRSISPASRSAVAPTEGSPFDVAAAVHSSRWISRAMDH